jgi:hypothetical protein
MPMRKGPNSKPDVLTARVASPASLAWRDPRIDALIDSYADWREECDTVETAYEWWIQSERSTRGLAYTAYRAALDREEKAAASCRLATIRLAAAANGDIVNGRGEGDD